MWEITNIVACFLLAQSPVDQDPKIKAAGGLVFTLKDTSPPMVSVVFHPFRVQTDRFPSLANLQNIRNLYVTGNEVSGAILKTVVSTNLKVVHAADTLFGDDACELLARSPLEELILSDCPITDLGLRWLSQIRTLRELSVSSSQITPRGIQQLKTLTKLHTLHVKRVPLDRSAIESLSMMTELTELNVSHISINDECIKAIVGAFPRLRSLSAYGSRVTDDSFDHLRSLKGLESLHLRSNKLVKGQRGLGLLTQVKEMDLAFTSISDVSAPELGKLKSIRTLDLTGTNISDKAVGHLGQLTDPHVLDVSLTNLSDEGFRNLGKLLPDTYIPPRLK